MGLRLSQAKTLITHIDEGLDFLGWRIQRHRRKGDTRRFVYTYPSKKALASITAKVTADATAQARMVARARRRDLVQPGRRGHHPLPLPGNTHRRPGQPQHEEPSLAHRARGEPDAVKAARPVREAGRRNGPVERPAPRCGPTSLRQDPRRAGRQPAHLRCDRSHPGRGERHPGAVGQDRRERRQVLNERADRHPQPGRGGRVLPGLRRAEKPAGGGERCVAAGYGPDLHRSPDPRNGASATAL
jgi:hypothetical protein